METDKEALQRVNREDESQLAEYALQSAKDEFVETQEVLYAAKLTAELAEVELGHARAIHNLSTQRLIFRYGMALDEAKGK